MSKKIKLESGGIYTIPKYQKDSVSIKFYTDVGFDGWYPGTNFDVQFTIPEIVAFISRLLECLAGSDSVHEAVPISKLSQDEFESAVERIRRLYSGKVQEEH